MRKEFFITALLFLFLFLSIGIAKFPPHISLIGGIVLLLLYGVAIKKKWEDMEKGMIKGIEQGLSAIFLLSTAGILLGIWMMSGTIPTILYYGLTYISPRWYYISALFLCIITSTFTGSSVITVSTVGVALIGMAKVMGIPIGPAAGAVICGACFGDKCSPLSETTSLAPGIVGVDLYKHVRHLLGTTLPALLITLLVFCYLGWRQKVAPISLEIGILKSELTANFTLSRWTLLPPFLVFVLAIIRIPALATFGAGILSGVLVAWKVEGVSSPASWAEVMQNGFFLPSEQNLMATLVNRGGLQPMMWGISLVAMALALGGLLQQLGIIESFLAPLTNKKISLGKAILLTGSSSILTNFLTGEQYLSILLPGKMFRPIFVNNKLPLCYLSRTLEDCGTLVNPLVPWGVCAAFYRNALNVTTWDYLPFCFFLYLSPFFSVVLGFLKQKRMALATEKKSGEVN